MRQNITRQTLMLALLLSLLLNALTAVAGSRGYYVAFVDISQPAFADGMEVILRLRKSASIDGRATCWTCEKRDGETGIAILYLKRLPHGVNADSVRLAIAKRGAALYTLKKRIRDFADEDGTRLDGLYAYERGKSTVTVHAIAPQEGLRVARLSQPINGRIPPGALDALLEKLAKTFPFIP